MDDKKLVGIVTERDYARKVILECMALMTEKRARHLPVLDHKCVIGVVSIGDLVKAMISEKKVLIDQLQHYISG